MKKEATTNKVETLDYCGTTEFREAQRAKKRNRLLSALALVGAVLIALPLAVNGASAGLDDGKFCIGSKYGDEAITGKAGGKLCDAPPIVEAPLPPQGVITITSCTITSQAPLNIFRGVQLSWTTSRELPLMRMEVRQGATVARVPATLIRETGRTPDGVVSYTATLSQTDLQALSSNLLGASNQLMVLEQSDGTHYTDPKWVPPAIAKVRTLTVPLSGLGGTCS